VASSHQIPATFNVSLARSITLIQIFLLCCLSRFFLEFVRLGIGGKWDSRIFCCKWKTKAEGAETDGSREH